MQNIIQKRNSLIWGVVALIVGILVIFNPVDAINFSVIITGLGLLAVGVIQLITFVATRKRLNMSWWSVPLGGILSLVLGVMLVSNPQLFVSFFMIFLAILIFILAIIQIYSLVLLKRSGAVVGSAFFVFPVLLLISSIVVVMFPLEANAWIVIFAGAWIAAYGVSEIVGYFAIDKPKTDNNPTYPDMDKK